jgi:ATP-dependent RNA helicase DOB1
MDESRQDLQTVITHPTHILPFLQTGRLVKIKYRELDFGWGVVVNFSKRISPKVLYLSSRSVFLLSSLKGRDNVADETVTSAQSSYVVDVLLACAVQGSGFKDGPGSLDSLRPASGSDETIQVVPVLLSTVDAISHLRIHLPRDLRSAPSRDSAWKAVKEIQRRWPKAVPLLDPIENMGIKDASFLNLVNVRFIFRPLASF